MLMSSMLEKRQNHKKRNPMCTIASLMTFVGSDNLIKICSEMKTLSTKEKTRLGIKILTLTQFTPCINVIRGWCNNILNDIIQAAWRYNPDSNQSLGQRRVMVGCCWQHVIVGVLTLAQHWSNSKVSTVEVLLLAQRRLYNYATTVDFE